MKTYLHHRIRNVIDVKELTALEFLDFEGKYRHYVEAHDFWEMCYAVYLSKLLVSCDICLKTLLASHNGGGYAYVLCNIAERIRKTRPDAQAILDAVLIHNPAAYLDNPCL